jgi:hypothetical protein
VRRAREQLLGGRPLDRRAGFAMVAAVIAGEMNVAIDQPRKQLSPGFSTTVT